MGEESISKELPFKVLKILPTPEINDVFAIAVGVDGQLCRLNEDWNPIEPFASPFPAPIEHVIINGDVLIATWIDRELLVARMGAIRCTEPFQQGVERGDVRKAREIQHAIQPAGVLWSHVLDAEPLGLARHNEGFIFILWNRGVYSFSQNGVEQWRAPPPEWPELRKLPMSQESVEICVTDSSIEIWSRAGGCLRLAKEDGIKIGTGSLVLDGALDKVYAVGSHRLLILKNGHIYWYKSGKIICEATTSGPIQNVMYNEKSNSWYLAGWREELELLENDFNRLPNQEVVVQHLTSPDGLWVVTNDGRISKSHLAKDTNSFVLD